MKTIRYILGILCFCGLGLLSTRHALNGHGIADSEIPQVLAQVGTTNGNGNGSSGGGSSGGGGSSDGGTSLIYPSEKLADCGCDCTSHIEMCSCPNGNIGYTFKCIPKLTGGCNYITTPCLVTVGSGSDFKAC